MVRHDRGFPSERRQGERLISDCNQRPVWCVQREQPGERIHLEPNVKTVVNSRRDCVLSVHRVEKVEKNEREKGGKLVRLMCLFNVTQRHDGQNSGKILATYCQYLCDACSIIVCRPLRNLMNRGLSLVLGLMQDTALAN